MTHKLNFLPKTRWMISQNRFFKNCSGLVFQKWRRVISWIFYLFFQNFRIDFGAKFVAPLNSLDQARTVRVFELEIVSKLKRCCRPLIPAAQIRDPNRNKDDLEIVATGNRDRTRNHNY